MNINIEELSGAFIDVRPIPFDFFGEMWEVVYPNVKKWSFAQVEKQLSEFGWTEDLDRLHRAWERYKADPYAFDTDVNLKGVLNECRERILDAIVDGDDLTPMMNYLYPIELQDPEEAQSILYHAVIPVVVVHAYVPQEDEWKYYLALSGGGMNLQWEICEAYIRLGYLPPVYFCDLPRMHGRGKSEADQRIIQACLKSIEVNRHHLRLTEQNLKKILEEQTLQNQ